LVTNTNNNYLNELTTRFRGKIVLPKNDPIFSNPTALKALEALYGPGNVIGLDEGEFLKYVSQKDFLSDAQAEYSTPLDYAGSDVNLPDVPTDLKLPPPTSLKALGAPTPKTSGGVTTLSQKFVFDVIPNANVTYEATVFTSLSPMPVSVDTYSVTISYPEVRVQFQTVQNALSYVLTITNKATKAFESIPVTPATLSQDIATATFTGVAHGTYYIKIMPYNADGVAGTGTSLINSSNNSLEFVV
jgi:hypothetical protein